MDSADPIFQRRSVRDFEPLPIPRSDVDAIVDAGLRAPSSKNRQPWGIHILHDREGIRRLSEKAEAAVLAKKNAGLPTGTALESMRIMADAACVVFVTRRTGEPETESERGLVDTLSIGACMENMCLEASRLGIGSLWVCDIFECPEVIREETGIADPVVSCLYLGIPGDSGRAAGRLPREDLVEYLPGGGAEDAESITVSVSSVPVKVYRKDGGYVYDVPRGSSVALSDMEIDGRLTLRGSMESLRASNVDFMQGICLDNCFFGGSVRFTDCTFGGDVDMDLAKTTAPLEFKWTCGRDSVPLIPRINFREASLSHTMLAGARIGELYMGECHTALSFVLRDAAVGKIDLNHALIEGELNLIGCEFGELVLDDVSLLGKISEDWEHISDAKQTGIKGYNVLKKNMNNSDRYRLEDEAYVEYKRAERRGLRGWARAASWLEDATGGYGTDPFRTFATILVIIAAFTGLFLLNGVLTGDFMGADPVSAADYAWESFAMSATSFTTLAQFSECACVSTKAMVLTEAFLGLFMMIYLSISFARRVLR